MAKLTKSMKEAIDQLAQQIISSAAYQNFQEKRALLANDPNFLSLYQQLEEKQDMLDKLADSEEDIPDEYLEELEEISKQLLSEPLFVDYLKAQDQLISLLELINDELSSLLGFDFADSINFLKEEEEGEEFWE
ncbi:MAG TPA: YlbF family regulator [Candidatus Atribacteria bacterium]|nr:YlbF family regulator [Atribacterota bacterium]NLY06340.1 YlbF family regulator [Candidatus Atribacteria bacterium]MDI9607149.1 YlbF family regulator [Atribacterota bacterium]HOA99631.1 YlbF family regulator [Candidatus Atribacteria bacterium]HOQ51570.1 YlbF family regulator [Candidatus Atribacteria bacterium]